MYSLKSAELREHLRKRKSVLSDSSGNLKAGKHEVVRGGRVDWAGVVLGGIVIQWPKRMELMYRNGRVVSVGRLAIRRGFCKEGRETTMRVMV